MGEEQLLQLILSGGSNIAFGLFLFHQNRQLQQRADEREAKQEERYNTREAKAEKNERDLRNRYDAVIADYQAKETATRETMGKEIAEIDKRLTIIEQKMEHIVETVVEIKNRFQGIVSR
jgi:uncharacterized membrane protein